MAQRQHTVLLDECRGLHGGRCPVEEETDEALAARAATDDAAFAELYRRYVGRIRGYCRLRLGEALAAEDATGDIFVKALEHLHRQSLPIERVRPWLFAIAHNRVVDGYRQRRDDRPLAELGGLAGAAPSPEEAALFEIDREALRTALGLLTPDQAAVIELRLSGLDGPEIRAVLNRSRAWVDTTQYRALVRLRELLLPREGRTWTV
jgi:RNA polymerase sigma factor (sigma-70 family)